MALKQQRSNRSANDCSNLEQVRQIYLDMMKS